MPLPRSEHEVLDVLVVELDLTAHEVADDRRPVGHAEAQHPARPRFEATVARVAVVAGLAAGLGPLLDLARTSGRSSRRSPASNSRCRGFEVGVGVRALEVRPLERAGRRREMPIHASDSMMPWVHSGRLRASSVSSMRSTNVPPSRRASAQL